MGRKNHYKPGSFYRTDDRTGFPQRAERTRKEWTGLIVDQNVWEARQPQDLVRGRKDKQSVPQARPLAPNINVGPVSVQLTDDELVGATVLEVSSTASFRAGCTVSIMLDSGETFTTIVLSVGAGEITVLAGLPYPASSGNLVTNMSAAFDSPVFAVLAEDAEEGDVVIEVESAGGFARGDAIDILLDDGSLFGTTIVLITGNFFTIGAVMVALASAGRTVSRRRSPGAGTGTPPAPPPPPPPAVPLNIIAPTITGTPQVGFTLSLGNGTWTQSPLSYAKVWLRGVTVIPGETGDTYDPTEDDVGFFISGTVRASNAAGPSLAAAPAIAVGPIAAAAIGVPVNTVPPAITGTPEVGQTLSLGTGTWDNSPTGYSRQWLRDGSPIGGATGATYLLVLADEGTDISGEVIASNGSGPGAPASADAVGPIEPSGALLPVNTLLPAISGLPIVDHELAVTDGDWDNSPTGFDYQWLRNGVAIMGATASTYTLVTADIGWPMTATVTASNGAGPATATALDPLMAGRGVTSIPTKTWAADSAELTSQGVNYGWNGNFFLEFTTPVVVDGFDFRGLGKTFYFHGTAIGCVFTNCMFDESTPFAIGLANGNNTTLGRTYTVTTNNCDHDAHYIGVTNGAYVGNSPKFVNTSISQYIGIFSSPFGADVTLDNFIMQMGVGVPPSGSHLEFVQQGGTGSFAATNGVFDISPSIRTTYVGGAGWTGVLSFGILATISNSAWLGVKEISDAFARVACSIAYNQGFAPTLIANLLGEGDIGYCVNSNGGAQRPSAAGANHDTNTGALLTVL